LVLINEHELESFGKMTKHAVANLRKEAEFKARPEGSDLPSLGPADHEMCRENLPFDPRLNNILSRYESRLPGCVI
jgi:hypothetical protein